MASEASQKKHTHWLYGRGPKKDLDFKVYVEKETDCQQCIHNEVCDHDMMKRCANHEFGTSDGDFKSCQICSHRFTRFNTGVAGRNNDAVPCFTCPFFKPKDKEANA